MAHIIQERLFQLSIFSHLLSLNKLFFMLYLYLNILHNARQHYPSLCIFQTATPKFIPTIIFFTERETYTPNLHIRRLMQRFVQ